MKMTKEDRYCAAGGVVTDGERVLILHRPSRNEIRLPKGHVNPGEDVGVAAFREVEEESGYAGLIICGDLGVQSLEFDCKERGHVVREEHYFLMQPPAGQSARPGPHEEQYKPEWVDWDVAERILTYRTEREWIRRARRKLAEMG